MQGCYLGDTSAMPLLLMQGKYIILKIKNAIHQISGIIKV